MVRTLFRYSCVCGLCVEGEDHRAIPCANRRRIDRTRRMYLYVRFSDLDDYERAAGWPEEKCGGSPCLRSCTIRPHTLTHHNTRYIYVQATKKEIQSVQVFGRKVSTTSSLFLLSLSLSRLTMIFVFRSLTHSFTHTHTHHLSNAEKRRRCSLH